ncbi:MAG: hypothetical protein ACMUHX_01800 [bacterium]
MKRVFLLTFLIIFFVASNLFANTYKSGTIVNETWTKANSPYCVDGDIQVAGLVIEPGVRIEFLGNYVFKVAGVLTANGTEQDLIIFTTDPNNDSWQGILFHYSNLGSKLAYCTIENSINSGVRIVNSLPALENCIIQKNYASQGGGLNIDLNSLSADDNLIIRNCKVIENTSSSHGGGIKANLQTGSLNLQGCEINKNISNPTKSNGNFVGGGIYSVTANSTLSLTNCKVIENACYSKCSSWNCSVTAAGGGIYTRGNINLDRCIIKCNYAWAIDNCNGGNEHNYSYGSGIYQYEGILKAANCIILRNQGNPGGSHPYPYGSGIYVYSGTAEIENCTIVYNERHAIINGSGTVNVINSILFFNTGKQVDGDVTVTFCDVQDGFTGEGNINGDPILDGSTDCESSTDLKIVPGSCCIDAGNPDPNYNDIYFPPSLGTERNDIGAHGGPGAFEYFPDCKVEMNLLSGWNMISLPVDPNDFSVSSLFPDAVVVYDYVKGQGYVRVEKSEIGEGYWILLDQNQSYTLNGQCIQSYNKTVYKDGWEMIGGCSYPAEASVDRCQISVIYEYAQGIGYQRLTESELLMPGKGYWVLLEDVIDQCELTVEVVDPNSNS